MSVVLLAGLLLVLFEVVWVRTPLRAFRWHFRGMLALFWGTVLLIHAVDAFDLAPNLYFEGIPRFASDAATYQQQASVLADRLRAGSIEGFFDPGFFTYSRGVAVLYAVFGNHPLVGSIFNAVFYMASVITVVLIGRRLANDRAGLLGAWLFACSPTFLLHDTQTLRWAATTAGLHVAVLGILMVSGRRWPIGLLLAVSGFAILVGDLPYMARLFMLVVAVYAIGTTLYRSLGRDRLVVAARLAVLAVALITWYRLTWPAPVATGSEERVRPAFDAEARSSMHSGPFVFVQRAFEIVWDRLDRVVTPALLARTGFMDDAGRLRESGVNLGTALEGVELAGFDEFVLNLPAAFRTALTEPTIPRLLAEGGSSSRLRQFAAIEMVAYYIVTVLAAWGLALSSVAGARTRAAVAFVVVLVAGAYMLLGTTILNGGTLHRLRQPYVAFLCVFAAVAIVHMREQMNRYRMQGGTTNASPAH